MTSETITFEIGTMDGKRLNYVEMNEWLAENTRGGRAINLLHADALVTHPGKMRIEVDDPDSAFWVKMRWGEDIVVYENNQRALAELTEIALSHSSKLSWFSKAFPFARPQPSSDTFDYFEMASGIDRTPPETDKITFSIQKSRVMEIKDEETLAKIFGQPVKYDFSHETMLASLQRSDDTPDSDPER